MSESENVVESGAQSAEDKFFGVRTKVGQESQNKDENQMEFDIEVVDDRPPEDRAYPRASGSADSDDDAGFDDGELEGYSKKVRKRAAS